MHSIAAVKAAMAAAGLPVRLDAGRRVTSAAAAGPRRARSGAVRWDADGLVPAVVQDVADGRVLMVAWHGRRGAGGDARDRDRPLPLALARPAVAEGRDVAATCCGSLDVALDCDGDALLHRVDPIGPTCHRGTRSCFDPDGAPARGRAATTPGLRLARDAVGDDRDRAATRPEGSYTTTLLDGGVDAVGRKVTEEATEVLLAAKNDERAAASDEDRTETRALLAGEAADLVYHALVLLAERGVEPRAVVDVLRAATA